MQEKACSPELCLRVREELVDLADCAASDMAARSLTLPPAPPTPSSLSLPLIATTPPLPSLPPSHPLSSFSFPSLSALEANALAGLQASCCQIGGPYSCWQRLKQWLGKERGEDERRRARKRKRESWREKGKKEAALGFASGRMRSSNIDSALCFFSSLFCALLSLAPPSVCVFVRECVCMRALVPGPGSEQTPPPIRFCQGFFFPPRFLKKIWNSQRTVEFLFFFSNTFILAVKVIF